MVCDAQIECGFPHPATRHPAPGLPGCRQTRLPALRIATRAGDDECSGLRGKNGADRLEIPAGPDGSRGERDQRSRGPRRRRNRSASHDSRAPDKRGQHRPRVSRGTPRRGPRSLEHQNRQRDPRELIPRRRQNSRDPHHPEPGHCERIPRTTGHPHPAAAPCVSPNAERSLRFPLAQAFLATQPAT